MPELELTYFDFPGGRGEAPRMALFIGEVPYTDTRVAFADWPAFKPKTPFGAMPLLAVDGQVFAQSCAVLRYVGKVAGLYPEDALQAAYCDETLDAIEEIGQKIAIATSSDADEKQRLREALAAGPLSDFLRNMAGRLESRGGEWFADGRLTVADLRLYIWMSYLRAGKLDHVSPQLADAVAPVLVAHHERVKAHPGVQAYDAQS